MSSEATRDLTQWLQKLQDSGMTHVVVGQCRLIYLPSLSTLSSLHPMRFLPTHSCCPCEKSNCDILRLDKATLAECSRVFGLTPSSEAAIHDAAGIKDLGSPQMASGLLICVSMAVSSLKDPSVGGVLPIAFLMCAFSWISIYFLQRSFDMCF